MCRMAAFISTSPLKGFEVEDFMERVGEMASRGRSLDDRGMGHPDGWGTAAFMEGRLILYVRETFPLWRRRFYARFRSDLMLVHARASSIGKVSFENTHPFSLTVGGRLWFLAHNGSVRGLKEKSALGKTDSEAMMIRLLHGIDEVTPQRLADRIREFRNEYWNDLSSMTFLLASGSELYAFKGAKERPDYFNLHVKRGDPVVISSEPLDGGDWEELENWSLLVLRRVDGRIKESVEKL